MKRTEKLFLLPILLTVMACLAGCRKDGMEEAGMPQGAGTQIPLYIPAAEPVTVYGAPTLGECNIRNAAVMLLDGEGTVRDVELIAAINHNGSQKPSLQLRRLAPKDGDLLAVVCNFAGEPTNEQLESLKGQKLDEARALFVVEPTEPIEDIWSYEFPRQTVLHTPLLMSGSGVWPFDDTQKRLRMTLQVAKISVVVDPAVAESMGWGENSSNDLKFTTCANPRTTDWDLPGIDAAAVDFSLSDAYWSEPQKVVFATSESDRKAPRGIYVYEGTVSSDDPYIQSKYPANVVVIERYTPQSGSRFWGLTYDVMSDTNSDKVDEYRSFERGKHYIFYVKDIYDKGYGTVEECMKNPSNVKYDIIVEDDWSASIDYNGQYVLKADADIVPVFETEEPMNLVRIGFQMAGNTNDESSFRREAYLYYSDSGAVPTSKVQLYDAEGEALPDNMIVFGADYQFPAEGYLFKYTATDVSEPMCLRLIFGNITKEILLGRGVLNVKVPATVSHDGNTTTAEIEAYIELPDGEQKPLPWQIEFTDEDGNVVPRPSWITMPAYSGTGSDDVAMTIAPQTLSSLSVMEQNPTVSNYDLSTRGGQISQNTANCYIVSAPGTYTLPLVYGNAIKDGQPNPSAWTSKAAQTQNGNVLTRFIDHTGQGIGTGLSQADAPYIYKKYSISGAKLLWQDVDGMITDVNTDGENLTFRVTDKITFGNAVLAVFVGDDIAWSWHIWVTDYNPYVAYDSATNDGTLPVQNRTAPNTTLDFMTEHLGWCPPKIYNERTAMIRLTSAETEMVATAQVVQELYEQVGSNLYYQWGRKDPLPGQIGNTNVQTYGPAEYIWPSVGSSAGSQVLYQSDIQEYIKYPYKVVSDDMMDTKYYNLWSADKGSIPPSLSVCTDKVVKTVYDPSPAGFCVPPSGAFTGFTSNGDNASSLEALNVDGRWENGMFFYCKLDRQGETIYFPASGARGGNGEVDYVGRYGYAWSSDPGNEGESDGDPIYGRRLGFHHSWMVNTQAKGGGRSAGFPIRPVREF